MNPDFDQILSLAWNQVWQVTVLVLLIGIVARILCRNRPHVAYLLWALVLMKCLTPPVFGTPAGIFCWVQSEVSVFTTEDSVAGDGSVREFRPATESLNSGRDSGERRAPMGPNAEVGLLSIASGKSEAKTNADDETEKVGATRNAAIVSNTWPSIVIPADTHRAQLLIARVLGGLWLAGVVVCLLVVIAKRVSCGIVIRCARVELDDELQATMRSVAQRLGITRRVRLVVSGNIGPAVFGILRPTILMPDQVLSRHSPEQVETILAHELVHVRRGDTFWGVLQTFAQILWWFHPLVWWANRQMSRERERCCDDEVVAGLQHEPAEYAQTLLDVLKSTRGLRSLAGAPGIRTVELTSNRLEHIMKSGHKHRRTPRYYWLVLLALIAVFIPGAGLSQDAAKKAKPAPLVMELTKEGKVLVLGQAVPIQKLKPILEELAKLRSDGPPTLIIQTEAEVASGKLVELIKLCQTFGTTKITLKAAPKRDVNARPIDQSVKPARNPMSAVERDTKSKLGLVRVLSGHTDKVNAVSISPDGRLIASGSSDDTIRLWDAQTGKQIASLKCGGNGVWTVAFSRDGRMVVCGCNNGKIKAWAVASRQLLFEIQASEQQVWSIAVSPDNRFIASGTRKSEIQIWDAKTGKQHFSFNNGGQVSGIMFTPDGRRIVTSSVDQPLKLWDVETGELVLKTEKAKSFEHWIAVSPNGRLLASAGCNGSVFVWDAKSGKQLRTLKHSNSPKGAGNNGGIIDGRGYSPYFIEKFGRGPMSLNSVAFSPDGRLLASSGDDRTVKLWDSATGKLRHVLKPHGGSVMSVAFSPDGRYLVSGAEDSKIRIWHLGPTQGKKQQ